MRALVLGALAVGLAQAGVCDRARGAALADAGSSPATRDARIEVAICAGRPLCRLQSVVDAGKSSDGRGLFAAVVRLAPVEANECTDYDVWAGVFEGQAPRPLQRLAKRCGFDEPTLRVLAPAEIRYSQQAPPDLYTGDHGAIKLGPGALEAIDFALDPPQIVRRLNYNQWWDYRAFEGKTCQGGTSCGVSAPNIPWVDAGDAFMADGWRTTSLGPCSAPVGDHARALISRGALYIEVADAALSPGASVDIEVIHVDGINMLSWRLGMNGRLETAFGLGGVMMHLAAGRHVEVATTGNTRRFRLADVWSPDFMKVRLAYGPRWPEHDAPFGHVVKFDPDEAVCTPHQGVLEVVRPRLTFQPWEELRTYADGTSPAVPGRGRNLNAP